MNKSTVPLELRLRAMENDRYETGEEPVEGEWQYADIESILLDLRRYLPLEETPEGVRLYAKSSVPTAPSYYLLAGRQQDPIRDERVDASFTPVAKKHFPVWKGSDRTSYRYPRYAAVGLLRPEGMSVSSTERNEVISALKVVALKNLLELYIQIKKVPGPNELSFLQGEGYQLK